MPSPAICRLASADEQIAAQHAVIAQFEAALWDGGFNEPLLQSYQSAWRRLEVVDRRRHPLRYAQLDALLRTQALNRDELLASQQRDLANFEVQHIEWVHFIQRLRPVLLQGYAPVSLSSTGQST